MVYHADNKVHLLRLYPVCSVIIPECRSGFAYFDWSAR